MSRKEYEGLVLAREIAIARMPDLQRALNSFMEKKKSASTLPGETDIFSKSFPKLSRGMSGRLSHKADYVRRIWEKYNFNRPIIDSRNDLQYTDYRIEKMDAPLLEFTLVSYAPNYDDIFGVGN